MEDPSGWTGNRLRVQANGGVVLLVREEVSGGGRSDCDANCMSLDDIEHARSGLGLDSRSGPLKGLALDGGKKLRAGRVGRGLAARAGRRHPAGVHCRSKALEEYWHPWCYCWMPSRGRRCPPGSTGAVSGGLEAQRIPCRSRRGTWPATGL